MEGIRQGKIQSKNFVLGLIFFSDYIHTKFTSPCDLLHYNNFK